MADLSRVPSFPTLYGDFYFRGGHSLCHTPGAIGGVTDETIVSCGLLGYGLDWIRRQPNEHKYPVALDEKQHQYLEKRTSSGKVPARQIKRAQILLKSDVQTNWSYEQIMKAFDVTANTVAVVRRTFGEQGLEVALQRKKAEREYEPVLDGEGEAHLVALACSEPPSGRKHWSLRLLQDRFVKLGYADRISYETIRRVLKKTNSSPG